LAETKGGSCNTTKEKEGWEGAHAQKGNSDWGADTSKKEEMMGPPGGKKAPQKKEGGK